MGKKKPRPTWYRRIVDALLPPGVWSDRRRFLTSMVRGGIGLTYGAVLYRLGLGTAANVACVPSVLQPLTGELVAVGDLVVVKIAGDSLSVGLGG